MTTAAAQSQCALFVSQTPTNGDSGPVALWITAASWAAAAEKIWGKALILTPEGVFHPDDALGHATRSTLSSHPPRWWRQHVPEIAITAYKDLRQSVLATKFKRSILSLDLPVNDVTFVWQHHDLFSTAGFSLANRLHRPILLFVDAPVVWEDHQSGVRRPGWGRLLERAGERRQLKSASLVACVSEEVAAEVCKRGATEDRVLVTPCGVDPERFNNLVSGAKVRRTHNLVDRFVVGWSGSFRPFHGLELTVRAAAILQRSISNLALLLVGDGQERHRIEDLARAVGLRRVVFTGTVPHSAMPEHIAAMDVAVVAVEATSTFHYSPIKLREYMACGRPIVAARTGQVGRLLTDGVDALLVDPGNPLHLASSIEELYNRPDLRQELGRAARTTVLAGSWDEQLRRVQHRLDEFPQPIGPVT